MCHKKIVLKFKSTIMRTTNNLFRKVHNCIFFNGDLLSLTENVIFWRFFIIFNILKVLVRWKMANFKAPNRRLVPRFQKESYTTLKCVVCSFKISFQNYGQLKRKILRPQKTRTTFLKFELSRLGEPMLKLRNAIRDQFEQQWFNAISFQKPRRVYTAIC